MLCSRRESVKVSELSSFLRKPWDWVQLPVRQSGVLCYE